MKTIKKLLSISLIIFSILLMQGCKKISSPDIHTLKPPKTSNYYLVCPSNYCQAVPNAISPVYPVSAEELFYIWNQMISRQSNVNYIYSIPELGQYQLVQRSFILGLPDDITVQFLALPDNKSTLAIFSQSRYGVYDFGMNKRRIISWLQQLNQLIAEMPKSEANEPQSRDMSVSHW